MSIQDPLNPVQPDRRRFLKSVGIAGAVAAGTGLAFRPPRHPWQPWPLPKALTDPPGELIRRMQQDLEEALAGDHVPQWLMVVDTRKCVGCDSCTVACRAENPTPPERGFRRVVKIELTLGLRPISIFKPTNCVQCDDPPCAKAVPEGLITKREDGIVEFDLVNLKGDYARAAQEACPFDAVLIDSGETFTEDTPWPQPYEERAFEENGQVFQRIPGANPLEGSARKCTFCSHLLAEGVLPACVSTCLGGAMYFGDATNPDSVVVEALGGRETLDKPYALEVGPRVIHLEEPMPGASSLDCNVCHVPGGGV
ncbi:MAG: 4Fe-4S dicluster domain-containing protein [Acidobacteriota bacterium]